MRLNSAFTGLLAFGISLVAVACSANDNQVGEMKQAPIGGATCPEAGRVAEAADGCNTCTCGDTGTWSCTELDCGAGCTAGATQPAGDGCNTCTCASDGTWACTLIGCAGATCDYAGDTYQAGDSFPSEDGCNSCSCTETGAVACTDRACTCPPPEQSEDVCITVITYARDPATGMCCEYGTPCQAPADWETFSTQDACRNTGSATCEYGGQTYELGETFPSDDGCNTCSCTEGGAVACTQKACASCPPAQDVDGACVAVIAWARDPDTGTCCQYGSPCQAPDGWQTYFNQADCLAGQ